MMRNRTIKLVLTALFACLIAIGAFIKIPVPLVPFTMQIFFVNLAGLVLGGTLGGISALIYMIIGLIGIPVFTQGGGISYIFNPTFGYIIGFVLGAFATGYISHSGSRLTYKRMALATLVDFVIVFTIGIVYCYLILKYYMHEEVVVKTLLVTNLLMCLPGNTVTCIISLVIAKRVEPLLVRAGIRTSRQTDKETQKIEEKENKAEIK